MIDQNLPRIVIVTRKSPYELLLEQHGTAGQAAFFLQSRGQNIADHEAHHERFESCLESVMRALPAERRRTRVDRDALSRFVFNPDDVVVIVGQDGLVPNAAKYLNGQLAIGINPDAERFDGILCPHAPEDVSALLAWLEEPGEAAFRVQERVMAEVEREDGQVLRALNEFFIGHRSHQSAKYRMVAGGREERQSSSGIICATGTGCTGWASSIAGQRGLTNHLIQPEQSALAWFVREPFASVFTQTDLDFGVLREGDALEIHSEMGEGGVVFADGIESDYVEFLDGQSILIRIAPQALNLVTPAARCCDNEAYQTDLSDCEIT